MGCATSKGVTSPVLHSTGSRSLRKRSAPISERSLHYQSGHDNGRQYDEGRREEEQEDHQEFKEPEKECTDSAYLQSVRLGNLHNYIEGEQVSAGWPYWLSTFAADAIQGWVPLKADSFEKLEMIGQGTYSSVFRARNLDTGKIVALKKVRFDNVDPESIMFMSREIKILRRLDHPNIMKLEGLITSPLSRSVYLVFEHMEHDLSGLSSCSDIKFSQSQVKCYMRQLLSGLEHCHVSGIMHRDIKGANLLVNNEGVLKIADFGLANFYDPNYKQPLTSRVVTLWYRAPELLLGSTNYEATIDLWSVGCVFAEMFVGRPILQGRTEVEQLHKIFRLCGSPPDEYWKKTKLTHATIFRPHQPYENTLLESFKHLPASVVDLLQTFLSIEPSKRGTASSALASEYFRTMPYACEPSSLPKYPPTKEMDMKNHDESHRRVGARGQRSEATRRIMREPGYVSKVADIKEESQASFDPVNVLPKLNGETRLFVDFQPLPSIKRPDEGHHIKNNPQRRLDVSGAVHVPSSKDSALTKDQREHAYDGANSSATSKNSLSNVRKSSIDLKGYENGVKHNLNAERKAQELLELSKRAMVKHWIQFEQPESLNSANVYHSQDFSENHYEGVDDKDRTEFSGPLLTQSHKIDELLQKNEHHIRHAVRRSCFQKCVREKAREVAKACCFFILGYRSLRNEKRRIWIEKTICRTSSQGINKKLIPRLMSKRPLLQFQ